MTAASSARAGAAAASPGTIPDTVVKRNHRWRELRSPLRRNCRKGCDMVEYMFCRLFGAEETVLNQSVENIEPWILRFGNWHAGVCPGEPYSGSCGFGPGTALLEYGTLPEQVLRPGRERSGRADSGVIPGRQSCQIPTSEDTFFDSIGGFTQAGTAETLNRCFMRCTGLSRFNFCRTASSRPTRHLTTVRPALWGRGECRVASEVAGQRTDVCCA